MRKVIAFISMLSVLVGCNRPQYEVINYYKDSSPLKSTVDVRILMKDSITKENLKRILELELYNEGKKKTEYHDQPTHLFVYIYKSESDYLENGGDWIAMGTKIKGVEDMSFKKELE